MLTCNVEQIPALPLILCLLEIGANIVDVLVSGESIEFVIVFPSQLGLLGE